MSFTFSTLTAVDAVFVLHLGRLQQSANVLSHVRILVDGVEVAEKIVGILTMWYFTSFAMYAFVPLSAGAHTAEVQVKTTSGTFTLYNDGGGQGSRFFGVLKAPAGSVCSATLDSTEALPSSANFTSLPSDLNVTVTVAQTVSLLLLLDVERLENTVTQHVVVRIAVDGAEACWTNIPQATGNHFRGVELACTLEVGAGTHVVRVEYKTGSTGVSVQARRRLFALVLDQEDMRVSESTSTLLSQSLASTTYTSLSPDFTVTVTTSQAATLFVFAHFTRVQAVATEIAIVFRIMVGLQEICASSYGHHNGWNYAAPVLVGAAVVPAGTHTVRLEYRVTGSSSNFLGVSLDGDSLGSLSVLALYSSGSECATDLGLASGAISDAQMTASNMFDANHGPERARITLTTSVGAWVAVAGTPPWYLTIDLGVCTVVSGVAVRGRHDDSQWALTFKVQYGDLLGGMVDYEESAFWHVFKGTTDRYVIHRRSFLAPFTARYVRIHIATYTFHPALRAEVYGCVCVTNDAFPLVETGAATLSASTASTAAVNGALNSGSAWVAGVTDTSQYLEVNLGRLRNIDYIGTQGHAGSVAWVTQYKVDYSVDTSLWATVVDPSGNEVVFMGNSNQLTVVRNPVRVYARYHQ